MFVRAKSVKGKRYAYFVVNEWKKGKVKQRVKKYLGKIFDAPPKSVDISVPEIDFSRSSKECIRDIIAYEFLQRGFIRKRETLINGDLKISFASSSITKEGKEVVLFINDHFLHRRLLDDVQDFFQPESQEETPGKRLAQAFSDAGIPIAKEWFVQLYKKIYLDKGGK